MILWIVIIILGLGLAIWWIDSSYQKLKEFEKEKFIEEIGLPSLEKELENLPEIKMPEIDEETLKELEKESIDNEQ